MTPRDRCLVGQKWANREPCVNQCRSCRTMLGSVGIEPDEETPEGLYLADVRRMERS